MAEAKAPGLTIPGIKERGFLLFEAVVGSQAYGTNTPESDTDIKGVFVMPEEFELMLGYDSSWDVILQKEGEGNDKVETEYFSLRKYMKMLLNSNPTSLEMLYSPEDCIRYIHPSFKMLLDNRQMFLTRKCEKAFAEFALQQMRKARGQDKKQNWTKERMTRKEVLDFCFTFKGQGSMPVKKKLEELGLAESECGLVRVPHMTDVFAVYHDEGIKYKGIVARGGTNVIMSSVARSSVPKFHMHFNVNAWTKHCTEIREWKQWENERNDDRWVDVQGHGQKIDGKNMLHSVRLIETSMEIATTGAVNVRRPNAAFLLDIKKGRLSLQQILDESEQKIADLSGAYATSALPAELPLKTIEKADVIHSVITRGIRKT